MKISIITDEIADDLRESLRLATEWGIDAVELRGIWGKRVPDFTQSERREIGALLSDHGVHTVALSPGLFKVRSRSSELEQHLSDRLPRTLDLADEFNVGTIIVFCPLCNDGADESAQQAEVTNVLVRACDMATTRRKQLAIENEAGSYAFTAEDMRNIIQSVDSSNLKVNWDPGSPPGKPSDPLSVEQYLSIRDLVVNVHVKDFRRSEPTGDLHFVPVGTGEVDWRSHLRALRRNGYAGHLAIETHYEPRVAGSRECYLRLKELINDA